MELVELSAKDMESIEEIFKSVFVNEPWNDDWSDEEHTIHEDSSYEIEQVPLTEIMNRLNEK